MSDFAKTDGVTSGLRSVNPATRVAIAMFCAAATTFALHYAPQPLPLLSRNSVLTLVRRH